VLEDSMAERSNAVELTYSALSLQLLCGVERGLRLLHQAPDLRADPAFSLVVPNCGCEAAGTGVPICWVERQRLRTDFGEVLGNGCVHGRRGDRLRFPQLMDEVEVALELEGESTREDLVEDCAEAVEVAPLIHTVQIPQGRFGRHVAGSAKGLGHRVHLARITEVPNSLLPD